MTVFYVVLMLTFMDGSYVQKFGVTAPTFTECTQTIVEWENDLVQGIKLWRKEPSTFITGCVKQ